MSVLRRPAAKRTGEPASQAIPRPFWTNPAALGGIGLTVAVTIMATVYLSRPSQPSKGDKQRSQPVSAQLSQNSGSEPAPILNPATTQPTPPSTTGSSPTKSAYDFYTQAEEYYGRGDWSRAKSEFQRIVEAPETDPSLRNKAEQRIKDVQNHIDELNWLKGANSALNRRDRAAAKTLYQKIADLNLEHAPDARRMIQQIDTGNTEELYRVQINAALQSHDYLVARQKLNQLTGQGGHDSSGEMARQIEASESQWLSTLQSQFDVARGASDVDQLQGLRSELEKIANSGGTNAMRARNLVDSVAPAIAEINKVKLAEAPWNRVSAESESALRSNTLDAVALNNARTHLEPFKSGLHSTEAQHYLDRIAVALTPPKSPQPPANSGNASPANVSPANVSGSTEQDKIGLLLDAYRRAFESKDQVQLRHIWPTLTDKQFKENQDAFKQAESIHITLKPNSPLFNGDTATVACLQIIQVKYQGQVQQLTQTVTFYLRKLGGPGGDWIVDRVSYNKMTR